MEVDSLPLALEFIQRLYGIDPSKNSLGRAFLLDQKLYTD